MELFTSSWDRCFPAGTTDYVRTAPPLTCAGIVIQNVVNSALVLSGIVAVVLIMYAGFQYATSSGDKEKVDTARKRIVYAVIGLVVIALSFTFINFIAQVTGVNLDQIGIQE